jgi:CRP-like cAMP-binding protein
MRDARDCLQPWLNRLLLRSELDAASCEAVLALPGKVEAIRPNRDFVALGELVEYSCLIVAGVAGRFGQVRDGTRHITALHIPGDMADLHSAVLPKAASALQSIGDVLLYRVPHAALKAAAARHPQLAEAFWRDCTIDAAILSQWAVVNTRLSAIARVAHQLCELACRYDAVAGDTPIAFDYNFTQAQVGDLCGLTAVHVNRMLRQLREAGLATVGGGRLTITDWSGLRRIAEFDPVYLHRHRAEH